MKRTCLRDTVFSHHLSSSRGSSYCRNQCGGPLNGSGLLHDYFLLSSDLTRDVLSLLRMVNVKFLVEVTTVNFKQGN